MSKAPGSPAREETDGRRQRSEASRERIVDAMLELVGSGDACPSAEAVAARANVGLRTVFRHFDNMESLYQQINAAIFAEVHPIMTRPFSGATWQEQIDELVGRRVRIFERIMPYKIAGEIHRHRSAFLAGQSGKMTREQRAILSELLPKERRKDALLFESLDLILSFDTWRRLRKEQKLSPSRSRRVIEHLVSLIVPGI